jgi:hypothetical protein
MDGKSTQKVVKIDEGLWNKLDEFLKTDIAKNIGYHSKAQFVTESVRNKFDLIERKYIITSVDLIHEFKNQISTLKEIHKDEIKTYKDQIREERLTVEKLKIEIDKLARKYRDVMLNVEVTDEKIIKKIDKILKERKINQLD